MRLVNVGNNAAVRDFNCVAEYGIQEGDNVAYRCTGAKTEQEARETFLDFLERNHPVEFPKMNITITENIELKEAV